MESTLQNPAFARTTPKDTTLVYWIITVLFCLEMSFTAYYELLPQGLQAFTRLGFPTATSRIELSLAKLAGAAALLIPFSQRGSGSGHTPASLSTSSRQSSPTSRYAISRWHSSHRRSPAVLWTFSYYFLAPPTGRRRTRSEFGRAARTRHRRNKQFGPRCQ